jgi:hypothetical protein
LNNKKHRYDNNNPAYELGFDHLASSDTTMSPLLILEHDPNARNASPSSAGLYHFAILVPDRKSLASTYLALNLSGVHFDGFADHLVSESLYLRDPEGNGIEIYCDRPSGKWPRDSAGNIVMDTLPLDLQSLIEEMNHDTSGNLIAFPTGAKIGHIHPFSVEGAHMLQHAKYLMEETEEDGSSLIAIDKRFDKLLTGLRTAVANEYKLDKEVTSFDDLVDAFRLSLTFYKRSKA